jgi:hypothetical protein
MCVLQEKCIFYTHYLLYYSTICMSVCCCILIIILLKNVEVLKYKNKPENNPVV